MHSIHLLESSDENSKTKLGANLFPEWSWHIAKIITHTPGFLSAPFSMYKYINAIALHSRSFDRNPLNKWQLQPSYKYCQFSEHWKIDDQMAKVTPPYLNRIPTDTRMRSSSIFTVSSTCSHDECHWIKRKPTKR
jgi:hypothetical protein